MHEMSIVEALIEAVQSEQRKHPGMQVNVVQVRVGQLCQVVPTAMEFCYQAATRDTPLAASRLEIEPVNALAHCKKDRRGSIPDRSA